MFQKPTFGSNATSGFGSFNAGTSASSPFGGFKPTTGTSAFSTTPAFGSSATSQPSTSGLFGSSGTTGGGLFGANTSAGAGNSAWGTSGGSFGFGSTPSTGNTLFGNNANSGLFSNANNTSAFGAKPTGFGFGSTTTNTAAPSGGLFGTTPSTGTGLFGQQNTSLTSGGGLFSNTTNTFGQQQQPTGTAHVKYNPVVGTDVVVKSGTSQNINIKHHCITCMKEYENKSLEELRLEDYIAGRKGSANAGMFSSFSQPTENKPLFGATGAFGQPASTSAGGVFGQTGLSTGGGFGQPAFSFGSGQTGTTTSGLFGSTKPAFPATSGTGLFGASTTQPPAFGTSNPPTFGFGSSAGATSTGLFGAKPTTGAFGATAATPAFGAFGSTPSGGLFGAKTTQTTAPTFGTATPAFGTGMAPMFGTNTSTSSGGIFGAGNAFGKPATSQPTFGFGSTQPTLGGGLGTGLTNTFQAKPAAPAFGTLGGGSMFQSTGGAFQSGSTLGGGLFGNTSGLGGASTLGGLGTLGANTTGLGNSLTGASATGNVHEQLLTLAARPYGESPLFKDLASEGGGEEALRPTNPAALKAVLERSQGAAYRVTSPTGIRLKLHPRTPLTHDKKSLFDGLEESDSSLEDKLCLKPSRKRLVLRTKANDTSHNGDSGHGLRSIEERPSFQHESPPETQSSVLEKENIVSEENTIPSQTQIEVDTGEKDTVDTNGVESHSWLSGSKVAWSEEKEKSQPKEQTKLYPSLEKEMHSQVVTERRASWLTSKLLRKPLSNGNPDSAENSIRDLGLRVDNVSQDKENVDTSAASEEENVAPRDMPPHPTGIKLTRPGYFTVPSLDEMIGYMRADGTCVLPRLTIGRKNYGSVFYDSEIEVAGLDLDHLVFFLNKEVIIYPSEENKPPIGQSLNRRAIVTLDRVWPMDKSQRKPITDPERLLKMDYEGKLRRVCDKHNTKFLDYRPSTGSWVFRVEHFSKYGLTDSDEEDDIAPEVMKRQLVATQALQQSSAPGLVPTRTIVPGSSTSLAGMGSLGGLGGSLGPLAAGIPSVSIGLGGGMQVEDSLYAMHQSSLNILNGTSRVFEMDTSEDNMESQSMYQDHRALGVKSPTSELARLENRGSHSVQLMKASLYAEADMEDDASVSTGGDQMVPLVTASLTARPPKPPSTVITDDTDAVTEPSIKFVDTEEVPMKQLIVRPHTVVLRYHRKVPPFQKTIAGRLGASCMSDMSVSRARHSRVGFGPRSTLAYVSSYDSVNELPPSTDLSQLGRYVRGRGQDDWSESVVTRMAVDQPDKHYNIQEVLSRHLETMLEHSTLTAKSDFVCPQAALKDSPRVRRQVLTEYLRHSEIAKDQRASFGVSGAYCHEVWQLCEALWGADLDNDGVPAADPLSVVSRHRRLLEWFTDAVARFTDDELCQPTKAEPEDETDKHSARVWTLLLGGRVLEACKLAKDNGDLNMATLIAQAAGDESFRALLSRQLSQWREVEGLSLMASYRVASLRLICGDANGIKELHSVDWLRALHATARFLCPQVPTLDHIIKTYERSFVAFVGGERRNADCSADGIDEDMDLSLIGDDTPMRLPLPDHVNEYGEYNGNSNQLRHILDLRYELLRARALNRRPKLVPASYTPDPFDYSLCFLLGSWFGCPSRESVVGLADQLESAGAWHLAVQVLMYHPDEITRGHLVRAMISRHAPSSADTEETKQRLELLRRLRIPSKWILLAQAHRAKYEHLPNLEVEHLVAAEEWNSAHSLLMEELIPDAVLADNLQSVSGLLQKMLEAAKRHEISGWESGGLALHQYLHVCDEIRGLVSGDKWEVQAKLEALRPAVTAACKAVAAIKPKSPTSWGARGLLAGRLLRLALAAELPAGALGPLLRLLPLPPDTAHHALHKITTELAEQASELCIEPPSSSPHSSHHRQTATS